MFCGATLLPVAPARAVEIQAPAADSDEPVIIEADFGSQWNAGDREVWLLSGRVAVRQGKVLGQSQRGVAWIERSGEFGRRRNSVVVYLEGDVDIRSPEGRIADQSYLGELLTTSKVDVLVNDARQQIATDSPIYQRAMARRSPKPSGAVQRTQFEYEGGLETLPAPLPEPDGRRFRIFKRGDLPFQLESFRTGHGDEQVIVITQGVNLVIDGMQLDQVGGSGPIDIATDRMVIWTTGGLDLGLSGEAAPADDGRRPVELYLEGNIVFRQGARVVYADRMYYDVNAQRGIILGAQLLTPGPGNVGKLRLKADVVRQESRDRFYAQNAFLTSSQIGDPRYRLQSGSIYFQDTQVPAFDRFTGLPIVDPDTGEQLVDHQRMAMSQNNFTFLGNVPVFYWPVLATDLEDPDFYLRSVKMKNDNVFGTAIYTDWDLLDLLGIRNVPPGHDATLSLDYLSERGPAAGAGYRYVGTDLGPLDGPYFGFIDTWFIHDDGLDNLGSDRRAVTLDRNSRGRAFGRHRQQLADDLQLTAEVGWISDRNFLEQYFENEWDEFKDEETLVELKQTRDNRSLSGLASVRLNDFFTQTEWWPRADHFWIGQSLLNDRLTWHEHTSLGYGRLRTASPPEDPKEKLKWAPLPWESTSSGARFITTHELDLPISAGAFKIVPYALGQFGYWGEDLAGNSLDRTYYQAGLRASIPFWAVYPEYESNLLNVHGLAHKFVLEVDAYHAEANENVGNMALYDTFDDDSTEAFRRRFLFNTFGGTLPPQFDPRGYAIRAGLPGSVTSPVPEVVDDMDAVRVSWRNRYQTKRGIPGQRQIIDWVRWDSSVVFFPDPDEDNFGEYIGQYQYDMSWRLGDRFTLLSDGALDLFDQGQHFFTMGAILQRPPRGSFYAGFRWLDGPFSSRVLTMSYNYQMSPKWHSAMGWSYDFGPSGNIGQTLQLTRVGESFLFTMGFNIDASKGNTGVMIGLTPRFLPGAKLGGLGPGAVQSGVWETLE